MDHPQGPHGIDPELLFDGFEVHILQGFAAEHPGDWLPAFAERLAFTAELEAYALAADYLAGLWQLLAEGRDAIGPFPRDRGWRVEVVTGDMFVGQRLTATMEMTPWHQRAAAKGILFTAQTDVERVTDRAVIGLDHFDRNRPVHITGVDLVVSVVHELPDEDLYFALKDSGKRVFRAGDCVAPRAMSQAILEGYRAGREV